MSEKMAGQFRVNDPANINNTIISLDGNNGDIFAGGHGKRGRIILINHSDQATVNLDGQTGSIASRSVGYAQEFDISEQQKVEPGMVLVIDNIGVRPADYSYDHRVVGVVGGGDSEPGVVLGKQAPSRNRTAVVVAGAVDCLVDAQYGSIEPGDLLTTSYTPGHAMKAYWGTSGAVIGKAMQPLREGRGLIPVLVTLK